LPECGTVRCRQAACPQPAHLETPVVITLNGERFELEEPLSVDALLTRLEIDARRVAVEHNLSILRRHRFPEVIVRDGDRVEIVNFVGGG
jgi:sulfur carrier protein